MWLPLVVLSAISTLLLFGGESVQTALNYNRAAIADGEYWRLFSDNFVHLGGWHLFLNLLSLILLAMLCPEVLSPLEWCRRIFFIGVGMSHVGLSGLIYGLFALGLGRQALQRDKIAIAACVFLAGRIGFEVLIGAPASEQHLVGGAIVGESHLYGAISALIYGALALLFTPQRKVETTHESTGSNR